MEVRQQTTEKCQRCEKELNGSLSFSFRGPPASIPVENAVEDSSGPDPTLKCLACSLLHRPMLKRSSVAALVVGTILTLLNQGDLLLSAQWSGALYWKIPLTYCVPFLVATYGALTNNRR